MSEQPTVAQSRLRLHFLDGLRGLSALYVVLFHEVLINDTATGELSPPVRFLRNLMNHGHVAVVFFIVLSGFSLMLPVARNQNRELVGGFRSYIYRRAKRILPPYYAALIFSIAVIVAYNVFASRSGGAPVEHALEPGAVITHLLLVHNLTLDWAYRINAPMWSVATEWQIYFVFALALLPLWRRAGLVTTVVFSWIVGSLPHFLFPDQQNYFWACPWFLGSFALGMCGASIGFSDSQSGSFWRERAPWALFSWLGFGVVVTLMVTGLESTLPYPVVDLFTSLFAFSVVNACVKSAQRQAGPSPVVRFLSSNALVALGGFSYSLYLIQHPFFKLTAKVLNALHVNRDLNLIFQLLFFTPIALAVAWIFAELFEKPFTTARGGLLPAVRKRFGLIAP